MPRTEHADSPSLSSSQRQGPASRSCASSSLWASYILSLTSASSRSQASALYETIEAAESVDEAGLPDQAFVVPEGTLGGTAPLNPTTGTAGAPTSQGQKLFDATGAH